jgi:hypothetical protein
MLRARVPHGPAFGGVLLGAFRGLAGSLDESRHGRGVSVRPQWPAVSCWPAHSGAVAWVRSGRPGVVVAVYPAPGWILAGNPSLLRWPPCDRRRTCPSLAAACGQRPPRRYNVPRFPQGLELRLVPTVASRLPVPCGVVVRVRSGGPGGVPSASSVPGRIVVDNRPSSHWSRHNRRRTHPSRIARGARWSRHNRRRTHPSRIARGG